MDDQARLVTVDRVWSGRWHGPSVVRVSPTAIHLVGAADAEHGDDAELPHVPGTLFSPFTDSHVHLGLVDAVQLVRGGVGRVLDLGWSPDVAALWPERGRFDAGWPEVQVAGGLLCPPAATRRGRAGRPTTRRSSWPTPPRPSGPSCGCATSAPPSSS